MASKKKTTAKKADLEGREKEALVAVTFKRDTQYGRKGFPGFVPASLADAWAEKGVVEKAKAAKKAKGKSGEDDSEGSEPVESGSEVDSSSEGTTGSVDGSGDSV